MVMGMVSRRSAVVLVALAALLAGCSSGTPAGGSSPARSQPPTTSTATTPPTTSPTPTPISPTKPALPTYSQVVAAYPAGVDMCESVASLTPGGYAVTGSVHFGNGKFVMPCYGAKITVTKATTVEGTRYRVGTKLTVNAKMHLVPVSSWD